MVVVVVAMVACLRVWYGSSLGGVVASAAVRARSVLVLSGWLSYWVMGSWYRYLRPVLPQSCQPNIIVLVLDSAILVTVGLWHAMSLLCLLCLLLLCSRLMPALACYLASHSRPALGLSGLSVSRLSGWSVSRLSVCRAGPALSVCRAGLSGAG